MERWNGKVAIVTGASAGIGAAIVEKLVDAGLQVVAVARRIEKVAELTQKLSGRPGKAYAVRADISDEEQVLRAFQWTTKKVGPVSILVNNAGVLRNTNLTDGDSESWRQVLDTNILGLCVATREAVKIMRANNIDGHIINISSVVAHMVPNIPNVNVYPASKHAVKALSETVRQELTREGIKIRISQISPGLVDTEILDSPTFQTELFKAKPKLQPEDVADALLYILGTAQHVQIHELILGAVGSQ